MMMSGVVGDQLKALKEQKVLSLFSCKLTLIRRLLQRNCLPCINVVLVKLAGTGGRASSAVWDDNTCSVPRPPPPFTHPSVFPWCLCLWFLFLHANERSHIDLASSFELLWQQYKNYKVLKAQHFYPRVPLIITGN